MSLHKNYFDTLSIYWNNYSDDEKDRIIDTLIEQDYYLNSDTPLFLRMNKKFILASLEQDMELACFIPDEMLNDFDIFKFLALHNYYSNWQIKNFSIDKILDKEIMNHFLEQTDSYGNTHPLYRKRVCEFLHTALHSFPKISTFYQIFDAAIEEGWIKNKNQNIDEYENVFAKICSYLRNNDTILDFDNLVLGMKIKEVLGPKRYQELFLAMEEYIKIYHGNEEEKLKKLEKPKDIISNLSSLYVSKCKESFKRKKMEKCYEFLKSFYILDLSNPIVYKKVSHYCKRRKFQDIYLFGSSKIYDFIKEMEEKYQEQYQVDLPFIRTCIHHFIVDGFNNFEEVIPIERKYFFYLNYKECLKLIHRLNSNYIKYEDPELNNYRHLIQFDEKRHQYVYIGDSFSEEQIETYKKYDYEKKVFNLIKKDLSFKIEELDLKEGEITEDVLSYFSDSFPFTDEYFKFDSNSFYQYLDVRNFIRILLNDDSGFETINFLNDATYQKLYEILIDGGVLWLRLLLSKYRLKSLIDYGIDLESIPTFINSMDKVVSLSNAFQINISSVKQFMLFQRMIDFVDIKTLAILKTNTILNLLEHLDFIYSSKKNIMKVAKNLVSHMVSRNYSTVPYIEGKFLDYSYSLYDSLDEEILLTGIYTDACFKCCGNDNDFLHYCALNKNGFVLKITDSRGNFIGRAAGFRHGNCVFFNQLRTIYDQDGNHYCGRYEEEQKDIIEVFKNACESIVSFSQNNEKEQNPIDYVFVNKCYALKNYLVNGISNLEHLIGTEPMDMTHENWMAFVQNTRYLRESEMDVGFYTDYGNYPVICMASSNKDLEIENNLNLVDVEALYQRKRGPILITSNPTLEIISKINKTKAISCFLNEEEFDLVTMEDGDLFIVGDNWYILYKNNRLVEQGTLFEDKIAIVEAETTQQEISKTFDYCCSEKNKVYQK